MNHLFVCGFSLLLCCMSQVKAQVLSVPLMMWSDKMLFRGENQYVETESPVDEYAIAKMFQAVMEKDVNADQWNVVNLFEIYEPTTELFVVFLRDALRSDELHNMKRSNEPSMLEGLIKRSKTSVVLRNTVRTDSLEIGLASIFGKQGFIMLDQSDAQTFLQSSKIPKNGKTDLVVIKLNPNDSLLENDVVIHEIVQLVDSLTAGNAAYAMTGNAPTRLDTESMALSIADNARHLQAKEMNALDCTAQGLLLGTRYGKAFCFTHHVYITPEILSGLIISFLLIAASLVGICALSNISSPTKFTATPLPIGKEY